MIWTRCPKCSNSFRVDASLKGRKGRCDRCREVFEIAEAEAPKRNLMPIQLGLVGAVAIVGGLVMASRDGGPATPGGGTGATDPAGSTGGGTAGGAGGATVIDPDPGRGSGTGGSAGGDGPDVDVSRREPTEVVVPGNEAAPEDKPLKVWWSRLGPGPSDAAELAAGALDAGGVKRLVINGELIRVAVKRPSWRLFLPCGVHHVVLDGQVREARVGRSYGDRYRTEAEIRVDPALLKAPLDRLVRERVAELDHPAEPTLLNLLGHVYLRKQQWDAALRYYNRAALLAPGFAPAHLNRAIVLFESGEREAAFKALRVAEELDQAGAFGLERGTARLRDRMSVGSKAPDASFDPAELEGERPEDDGVVNALMLVARLGASDLDAVAALNNAGLRMARKQRWQDAERLYRAALRRLSQREPSLLGRASARTVYQNLCRLYQAADWPEKAEVATILEAIAEE